MTDRRPFPPFFSLLMALLLGNVLASLAWATSSQSAEFERTLESRLLADAEDGRFDRFTLIEAALVAGGIDDPQELARLCRRFEQLALQLELDTARESDPLYKADGALRFLHRHFLTGAYRSELAELDRTLSEGVYNCLTATILYQALCQRLRIPATAISAPGHVLSRLSFARPLKVETTCSTWFKIVHDPQRSAEAMARYRGATSPEDDLFRELTQVQLVAKVYYNRASGLLAGQHFSQAVEALKTSVQWDPADIAAHENLLAGLNNWALSLCDEGRFAQAAELLDKGLLMQPDYELFAQNRLYIMRRWAVQSGQ